MDSDKYRVLILDDDYELGGLLRDFLQSHIQGSVTFITRVRDLWNCLEGSAYDILFLDYKLGDTTGIDVLEELRARGEKVPTVMMTGEGNEHIAAKAIQLGALDYLVKGEYSFSSLPPLIQKVVRQREIETAMERYTEQIRYQATLLDNMRDAVIVWDMHGKITYWNQAAEQLYGATASERIGSPVEQVYFPCFDPPITLSTSEPGKSTPLEHRFRLPDGRDLWISSYITPLVTGGNDHAPFGFMDVARDITPRMQAEERLEQRLKSEKLLASISNKFLNLALHDTDHGIRDAMLQVVQFIEVSFGMIFLLENNHLVPYHLYRAQPGLKMNFYLPDIDLDRLDIPWLIEQLKYRDYLILDSPTALPPEAEGERRLVQQMSVQSAIFVPMIHNHELYGMVVFGTTRAGFHWSDEHVYFLQTFGEIITNSIIQKQVDQALRKSEARYRAIVDDHQTEMICRFLKDTTLSFVNEAYCRYYNKERRVLTGASFLEPLLMDDREAVRARLASLSPTSSIARFEMRVTLRSGEVRWQEWTSRAIFDQHSDFIEFQAVGHDITDRKKMEDQLKTAQNHLTQAARLASIGELASGVAHQISNPLTTIIADAQILTQQLDRRHPGRESAEAIVKAGWRTQAVINELMKFSQPAQSTFETVSVNETIEKALLLTSAHLQASGIKIVTDLAQNLPTLYVNPHQITDLWLNLLLLARSASADGKRHTVKIRTRLSLEQHIQVEFTDDGKPIPRDQFDKIFEPQLVPTGSGRGTGMELSLCREIVRQNRGAISVSASGNETTFRILFSTEG